MSATVPPISSCCSRHLRAGGMSMSPIAAPPPTTRRSSGTCRTDIFHMPARSFWFRTISVPIPWHRYTRPSPAEARRLAERFEWHYTPKHGSWIDMAESELGVLSSQCLDRRVPDKEVLIEEVAAWQAHRNEHNTKASWQFTNEQARIKLRHLYPSR